MTDQNKPSAEELIANYENIDMLVSEIEKEMQEKIESLIPPVPDHIQDRIAEIKEQYDEKLGPMLETRSSAEKSAKEAVIELGESVKGNNKHFVFSVRTSWNSKGLEGYAVVFPDVLKFQEKKPSVSIRSL